MTQFVITKKIAKQGKNSIIVIPKMLQEQLRQGMIVKLTIDVIKNEDNPAGEV